MAYAKITFENPDTGQIRQAPVGFSWTVLFFGLFPALFRSDWKWAIIMFLIFWVTFGFSNLVFMFIYNKLYVKELLGAGFKAKAVDSGNISDISGKLGIEIPALEAA